MGRLVLYTNLLLGQEIYVQNILYFIISSLLSEVLIFKWWQFLYQVSNDNNKKSPKYL